MKTTRKRSALISSGGSWQKEKRAFSGPSRIVLFTVIFIWSLVGQKSFGQGVGISETSIAPDPSSILELKWTAGPYKGFLVPRMTTANRITIASPAQGLIVYDTTTKSFWYYDGGWKAVMGSGSIGTSNQLLGMDAAGLVNEYKTLNGTTNQINVSFPTAGSIVLSTPQNIHTGASPVFVGLTLSGLTPDKGVYTTTGGLLTTSPPNYGTLGFWDRNNATSTLTPTTPGDHVTTTGNIYTTGSGAITSADLLTGNKGLLITGADVNLINSGAFNSNINAGNSTGNVNIGTSIVGGNTITIGNNLLTTGIIQKVGTGNFSLDGAPTSTYNIGASTVAGNMVIGGTAQTGAITLGSSTAAQTVNIGTGTGANAVNIASGGTGNVIIGNITGTVNLPKLTASLPVKTDGSKNLVSGSIGLASTDVSGVLPVANGGTNASTALTNNKIMVSNTGQIVEGPAGSTTTVLHGNAAGLPSYGQIVNADITNGTIDLPTKVTGVLPVIYGGTGQSSYVNGEILIGNSTGNTLTKTTLTGTLNQINVTNGPGSIQISTPQNIHAGANPTFAGLTLSGLAATSAVYTDASSGLTTSAPTSGTIGYWNRTGTVLSPLNVGDAITTSGNISTTGTGTITASDLLSGNKGLTVTGAAVSLNSSSNFPTNINTGTSTGAVTIGNTLNTITLPAFSTAGLVHNDATGVLSTGLLVNNDITNGTIDLVTKVTNVLPVANGGTNASTALTNNKIMVSNTGQIVEGPAGSTTTVLHGNAAGLPSYGQIVNADITNGTIDLPTKVTGVLPVIYGGTGQSSYVNGEILIGNSTGNTLTKTTLTGTLNQINVTNGPGSIQISTPQNIHAGANPTFAGLTLSGLAATSAVYTDASSGLTTSAPTSGTIGYWNRTGTVLSPLNVGDAITTSGNISTTGTGTITASDLLSGNKGLTVTGAAVSLNSSSNFPTNINTGTSTGAVTIGNTLNTITLPAFSTAGLVHNDATGVLSTGLLVNNDITNGTIDLVTKVTNVLLVANGGTNASTALTNNKIMVSNTGQIVEGPAGSTTTVLHGNAAGLPSYGQIVNADITNGTIDLPTKVTGVLPVIYGGTGQSSYVNGEILIGNSTGNTLTKTTLTGTLNQINVTNGPGSIQISTPQNIHAGATPTFAGLTLSGLAATSAVYTDASSGLTTSAPTSGTIGYWNRTGTVLSPLNVGDAITTSGNISTTGTGTITASDLLTGNKGLTVTGAAVSLNSSSNFPTNINTGTSTGAVTIGNTLNTITLPAFSTAGLVHNDATGVLSTGLLVNNDITNGTIDLVTKVTNVLPVANGGTNASTALTNNKIMVSNTGQIVEGPAGSTTTVLHGNAAGLPSYGQIVNADITNNAVSYSKIQVVSAFSKLLGSSDASTAVSEISLGSGLSMTGSILTATGLGGTVTNFSSGDLSPLFTTSVTNPTTTPALSFSLTNAGSYTLLGNNTALAAPPTYFSPLLASALFANQGTVNNVLHGNAAGNPSWSQIVNADIANGTIDLPTKVTGLLPGTYGGTGVNNGAKLITVAGDFTTTGANALTLNTTGTTSVTLPLLGTLSTLDGTETFTNKTLTSPVLTTPVINGTITGTTVIPIVNGGTNSSTALNDNRIMVSNSGKIVEAAALTDGQVIVGKTGAAPQLVTLGGDASVSNTGGLTLSTVLATPGSFGNATTVPVFTVDNKGRITAASSTTISGVSPIGSALNSTNIIVGDASNLAAAVNMSGDATISNTGAVTVGRINGATVPASAGALVTGNVLQVDGINSTTYGPLNLAGGATYVTGLLPGTYGGTGVNNGAKLITVAGDFTTTGANALTLNTTGTTSVTLPLLGTLATLDGTETFTNKTLTSPVLTTPVINGTITGTTVIPIVNGGTNSSTALNDNRIMVSNSGKIVEAAVLTDGQVIVGKTGAAPQLVTLGGDASVNNTGGLTLSAVLATPGSFGNATTVPVFTVDNKGRITAASSTTISGVSPIGSALNSTNIIVGDASNLAAAVNMSGDATISNTGAVTVGRINGATVPASAGALVTGNVLQVDGINSTTYGPLNLAGGATFVAGLLPGTYGGTGVNNGAKLITVAGDFSTTGANALTLNTTGTTSVTLPTGGTLATLAGTEILTNKTIAAGSNTITGLTNGNLSGTAGITNANLANSAVTIGTTSISLGSSSTTLGGLTSVTSALFTGPLTGNATTATTASNLAAGGAGTIPYQSAASTTAMLGAGTAGQVLTSGGAGAPTWTTPTVGTVTSVTGTTDRITIGGTASDPIIDIAGTYLGQNSITTLGTITTGTWNGNIISPVYGGTGKNNGANTITLGGDINTTGALTTAGDFSTTGANALTLNTTGTTSVTLPTGGTLATLAGTEILTNKTIAAGSNTITGLTNGNLSGTAGITNANLANSAVTIGTTSISLGSSSTTLGGLTSVTSALFTGPLTGNATTATTASNLAAGGAGTIPYQSAASTTAMLGAGTAGQVLTSGGAGAPTWTTPTVGTVTSVTGTTDRITIGGTASDPIIDIAGTYLGQNSITTLGTITTGTWNGNIISPVYGGTGKNNGANTITLGGDINTTGALTTAGDFSTTGANALTLNTTGTTSVTLPTGGTLATLAGTEILTNKTIAAGSNTITGLTNGNLSGTAGITNANLANSAVTIGTTSISLGSSSTTLGGLTSVTSALFTGPLTGNATTATTASNLAAGGAGTIPYQSAASTTAMLGAGTAGQVLTSGGAGAPTWTTPTVGTVTSVTGTTDRITIGGTASDPIIDIAGTYLGQNSITTLGTITTGTWNGNIISPVYGGTGKNNGANTITLGGDINTTGALTTAGDFSTTGANALTLNTTGTTSVTLPTGGTLATLAGTEILTNKTIAAGSNTITGLTNGNLSGTAGITNANLANSAVTIGTTSISLGSSSTTLGGLTSVTSALFTGPLTGNATTATTASNLAAGGAGTIPYQSAASTTAMLGAGTAGQVLTSGGAGAPTWTTPTVGTVTSVTGTTDRITIGGTASDPIIDIAGTYLGQNSITTLGTITTGTWNGNIISPVYGGTGKNNGANTITLGGDINTTGALTTAGDFSTTGANALTLNTTGTTSVTLPTGGTLATLAGTEILTNKTIAAGSNTITGLTNGNLSGTAGITNANLANSAVTIGTTSISLGSSSTTLGGLTSVTSALFTGPLTGNATTATTASNLAAGGAGTIPYQSAASTTAMLGAGTAGQVLTSGGAGAPTWTTPTVGTVTSVTGTTDRITIGGTASDPIIDIAGTYLGQNSITTLGTITTGTWNGNIISPVYGGTGKNNGANTITLGGDINTTGALTTAGDFSTTGANALTLNTTGTTSVTLPTGGTLATLAGTEILTNKTIAAGSNTITGLTNGNLSGTAGITNANLANSAVTIGTTSISLGSSSTTLGGLTSVTSALFTGPLTGNATTATTASNLAAGGAGTIPYQSAASTTAMLGAGTAGQVLTSGGAGAPTWTTPTVGTVTSVTGTTDRITIGGTASDPIIDIAGTYLGQNSITTLGTITTGTWNGNIISPVYGGTGKNNGANTITLGGDINTTGALTTAGDFSTTGANALTLNTTGTTSVTLPTGGTLATLAGTEILTNKTIAAGSNTITGLTNGNLSGTAGITNANLANSAVTIGTTSISLGSSSTTLGGLTSVTSALFTGPLTGNATTATTASNLAAGGAGTIPYQSAASTTAMLGAGTAGQVLTSGGAGAPTWTTPTVGTVTSVTGTTDRITIGGTASDPIIDIAGTYLGQNSITTLGTITTGTWNGNIISPVYGGTGKNNGANTITLGGDINTTGALTTAGDFSTTGANALTLNTTGTTSVTLPTGGTLATLAGTEILTNKTIAAGSNTITGLTNGNLSGTAGITNANLANSAVTIGTTSISLGSSSTTLGGLTSVTSALFTGPLTGNATTATTASNLAAGGAGTIPYQSAASTTAMLGAGTAGQVLTSGGAGAPTWASLTSADVGLSNVPNIDATNASNISSGILAIGQGGTGSATQNFVDITTGQTVAGAKIWSNIGTFNAGITVTGGTINLNNDANTNGVNIGGTGVQTIAIGAGGTGAKTITIGDGASSGSTTIESGTGPLNLGVSNAARSITIGTNTAATAQTINLNNTANAGIVNIGNGITAGGSLTIGGTNMTSSITTINGGTGTGNNTTATSGVLIQAQGAGTVNIGKSDGTGAITLGSSSAAQAVNIGTGTGANSVNIATAGTGNVTIGNATGNITLPKFIAGSVPFIGPSKELLGDTSKIFWDNTNSRLGIGTSVPVAPLDVRGDVAVTAKGSNTTNPRTIGLTNWGTNNAARFTFGDPWNALQNTYGGRMQLTAYWGIEITGNRENPNGIDFATGLPGDPSLNVIGNRKTAPILDVSAPAGQTSNMQEWKRAGTVTAAVSSMGTINLKAGVDTVGGAPVKFASGTNLTTAEAGTFEYDGNAFYSAPVASGRGVSPSEYIIALTNNYTGTNNGVAQKVFGSPANGTITLSASTSYMFEGQYNINSTGGNSVSLGTLFGGTASITSIAYTAFTTKAASTSVSTPSYTSFVTTQASTTVTPASGNNYITVIVRGIVRTNAAGTFIPQFQFSGIPGAAPVVAANSYFKIYPIGTNTVSYVGNWN